MALNIDAQSPAYTITVGEIIDEFEKAKNRQAKKQYWRNIKI